MAFDEETIAFAGRVFQQARSGDAEGIAALLEQGLPPNLRNDKGDTLLMLATYYQHFAAVESLLLGQADPNIANDRGQTPLAAACFRGDRPIVELLLAHGAAVDGCGEDGRTPLMMAAMFNRVDIVKILLEAGAQKDRRDILGMTAEQAAEKMGAADSSTALQQAQNAA